MDVTIEQVRKAYEATLMSTPGVVGVGHVGDKIRIYVEGSPDFPETIAGYPTEIVKVGHIRALPLLAQQEYVSLATDRTSRMRPTPGGCSVGHFCYDDATQVMTSQGLRYFWELGPEDEVATLNCSGELEYHKPTGIFHYDYDGQMIAFGGKRSQYDLLVTPNHKLYVNTSRRKPSFRFVEAQKALDSKYVEFKKDAIWNCETATEFVPPLPSNLRDKVEIYNEAMLLRQKGYGWRRATRELGANWRTHIQNWYQGRNPSKSYHLIEKVPINLWMTFLGWYLSEGTTSRHKVRLSQSRVHKQNREELIALIHLMGFKPIIAHSHSQNGISFSSLQLAEWLSENCGKYSCDKRIPRQFKELHPSKLRLLLDSIFKGDGCFIRGAYEKRYDKRWHGRYFCYITTSKQLAEDVCELLLKCGLSFNIKRIKSRSKMWRDTWRVQVVNKYLTPRMESAPQAVHYEGKIHCIEAPNHVILVVRDGKPVWCGNSITAGTLSIALDLGGRLYGLSNCHVLANADSVQKPSASVGDEILQPGPYDSGRSPDDVIGRLFSWVPLDQTRDNLVDVAIFEPLDQADLSREILEVGEPTGFGQAYVGEHVRKSGRTSGLTTGIVQDIDATITVDYGSFEATFVHQIMTSFLADPGDSGSALLDEASPRVVGLLYSGSEFVTCHNQINPVLQALEVGPRALGTFPWRTLSLAPLGALALYLLR